MPASLLKVFYASIVVLATLGLFAVCVRFLSIVPLPEAAVLHQQFWSGVPPLASALDSLLWYVRYGLFMLANVWVLWLVPVLGIVVVLWVLNLVGDEETSAYAERAYVLERNLQRAEAREAELRSTFEKLHNGLDGLFAKANEMWLVLDADSKIRRHNQVALDFFRRWLPSLELTENTPLSSVFPGYINTPLMRGVFEAGTEGKPWYGEIAIGDQSLWVLAWVWPLDGEVAVVLRDVSHRHKPEASLQSADALVRQLVEDSIRPVAVLNAEFKYMYVSRRWHEVLGLNPALSLIGMAHQAAVPHFPKDLANAKHQLLLGHVVGREDERFMVGGTEEILSWHLRPWRDAYGKLGGYIFTVVNQTEYMRLKAQVGQAKERENALAYSDMLTGLPNRQLFHDRLNMALAQAYRQLGKVALLFLDLDGFKAVNDNLGHDAGDMLLKQVAGRLQTCVRQTDTLARLGGDEFTMILSVRDAGDAEQVAQKILNTIAEPFDLNGSPARVGTSIGIAMYPAHAGQAADLVRMADAAMYSAKQSGKNTYKFYDPELEKANA
jgi:diguanylate cyclase (GGDEF)-like protein/PAS domain S-box-containing protein